MLNGKPCTNKTDHGFQVQKCKLFHTKVFVDCKNVQYILNSAQKFGISNCFKEINLIQQC